MKKMKSFHTINNSIVNIQKRSIANNLIKLILICIKVMINLITELHLFKWFLTLSNHAQSFVLWVKLLNG